MDQKANPIPKRGERNIYCPFYNDCLDYAVEDSWQTWNCSQCPHKIIEQAIAEYEYVAGDADLEYDLAPNLPYGIRNDTVD